MPIETLDYLTGLLHRHRKDHDLRPVQRAATSRTQPKLMLRWYREDTWVANLAADHGLSQAAAYRYLHEGIDVLDAKPLTCTNPWRRRSPIACPICPWTGR